MQTFQFRKMRHVTEGRSLTVALRAMSYAPFPRDRRERALVHADISNSRRCAYRVVYALARRGVST